ncbi:MAG: hypothetical protein HQK57_04705 [Deltaproteobacteria bacterium]|nr:hypothetical protein [Deltaproteobacteria bacterium]
MDRQVEKAVETSHKTVVATEKEIGEDAEKPKGPVGLDIGTSFIVAAQNKLNYIHSVKQANAFFTVPKSKFAKSILNKNEVLYYEQGEQYYIVGFSAESFANMFNTDTRRPIKDGLLSATEKDAITVIQALVGTLIQRPKFFGETLCFAIPGEPLNGAGSAVVYHEAMIKRSLSLMGYTPISLNEGMAVVISELADDNFTGIGISMGGGMCNICLSYLSFPVITYSLQMAGDYIDSKVGSSLGEPATKIKTIKEEGLDLSKEPKDRVMTALHIFYDDLIANLIASLQRALTSSDQIPKIAKPIPIVLSGGSARPKGCVDKFAEALKQVSLPVEISSVRLAEDPFNTTAKGALIMAMTEAA